MGIICDVVVKDSSIMSVLEIQTAIVELPPSELGDLIEWIEELKSNSWDHKIEQDVEAGRFDMLRQRAHDQRQTGQCKSV